MSYFSHMLTVRSGFPGNIFLFSCLVLLLSCQPKEQDIKSVLYAPMPNVIMDVDEVNETNRPVADAFKAYEKGNYSLAEERFTALPEDLKTPDVRFYLGMAKYAQGKYNEAKASINFGGKYGSRFGDAARYYGIIVDYERGSKASAFEQLKNLLYNKQLGAFTEKGQQLLEYLAVDPDIPENRDR